MLSSSRGNALKIIQEAKDNGIILAEIWAERYNSFDKIKSAQASYKEDRETDYYSSIIQSVYEKFQKMIRNKK